MDKHSAEEEGLSKRADCHQRPCALWALQTGSGASCLIHWPYHVRFNAASTACRTRLMGLKLSVLLTGFDRELSLREGREKIKT